MEGKSRGEEEEREGSEEKTRGDEEMRKRERRGDEGREEGRREGGRAKSLPEDVMQQERDKPA